MNKSKFAALVSALREKNKKAKPLEVKPSETTSSSLSRLAALRNLAKPNSNLVTSELPKKEVETHSGIDGSTIVYNAKQNSFVTLVAEAKSCVLIGSAGSGKTTCTQGAISSLIQTGVVAPIKSEGHRHLLDGSPGVVTISYTRRAVNNIRKVLPLDLKSNCMTAHKLLEFAPEYFEVYDKELGEYKKTMQFVPTRDKLNPLPNTIHTIVVEESSMLDVPLFKLILDALAHKVQWVFIGDINQLPPVFGSAILGYKMLELPVVELTEIYRQALESPIIRLAHRILSGVPLPASEFAEWKVKDKLTLHAWKKRLHADDALRVLVAFFKAAIDSGQYDTDEDIVLIPYNKSCGTLELNKEIANYLARKRGQITYEIVSGFIKCYFSVGDKLLYDKEDAELMAIEVNPAFTGVRYQKESKHLDYWGHNPKLAEESHSETQDLDVDLLLAEIVSDSEERVAQASHKLIIKLADSGVITTLSKAGDINKLTHGYALTVHKAQGSEWRKVFLTLHASHSAMLQRELIYTAVTRAKEELYVICEPDSLVKGILSQKIKGDSLEDKANYFKGKKLDKGGY